MRVYKIINIHLIAYFYRVFNLCVCVCVTVATGSWPVGVVSWDSWWWCHWTWDSVDFILGITHFIFVFSFTLTHICIKCFICIFFRLYSHYKHVCTTHLLFILYLHAAYKEIFFFFFGMLIDLYVQNTKYFFIYSIFFYF